MSLLYVKEHLSCSEYTNQDNAVFRVYVKEKGVNLWEGNIPHSSIVFVVKGAIVANCQSFHNRLITAGQIFFLPKNAYISGKALEETILLHCVFDAGLQLCNRFSLEKLLPAIGTGEFQYDFTILPVRDRMQKFLDLLMACLGDGLGCFHFHQAKRNELLLLMRGYYTKEELVAFFYPILSTNLNVVEFALANYNKVKDVKEFAALANMSPVTFNRHFKKAMGESAAQWLEKQKATDILREIQQTDKTFSEIASDYNFSSAAYFATFCKRHFKKTAKELREEYIRPIVQKVKGFVK